MRIINSAIDFPSVFEAGRFDLEKWDKYMDKWLPDAKELCRSDMKDCLQAGCSWEEDYLPVLQAVFTDREKREEAVRAFCAVSEHLDEKITQAFGKTVDADLVLYIGLCNGAGWVTKIRDRITVLLGIEKIMELGWCDPDNMTGLIVHELGHVFQAQYGSLFCSGNSTAEKFLWQLFTEGVAMVFEQETVGDAAYFHQDRDGWKAWCEQHFEEIKNAFYHDLNTMTPETQRYFGDWVRFEGRGDVGYYLGARFVRCLLSKDRFENVIGYSIETVQEGFESFMRGDLR